jgi:predicted exporter
VSQAIHDSRRQLERVWWAVLVAVIATLATAALVYFVGVPRLRVPLAPESAAPR